MPGKAKIESWRGLTGEGQTLRSKGGRRYLKTTHATAVAAARNHKRPPVQRRAAAAEARRASAAHRALFGQPLRPTKAKRKPKH